MERGDQVKQQPLVTQPVSGQDLNWMVRIQNSLSFIRAIKGPGDQECFIAVHCIVSRAEEAGTPTDADDQHKKGKQRPSKGSRGLAVGRG